MTIDTEHPSATPHDKTTSHEESTDVDERTSSDSSWNHGDEVAAFPKERSHLPEMPVRHPDGHPGEEGRGSLSSVDHSGDRLVVLAALRVVLWSALVFVAGLAISAHHFTEIHESHIEQRPGTQSERYRVFNITTGEFVSFGTLFRDVDGHVRRVTPYGMHSVNFWEWFNDGHVGSDPKNPPAFYLVFGAALLTGVLVTITSIRKIKKVSGFTSQDYKRFQN